MYLQWKKQKLDREVLPAWLLIWTFEVLPEIRQTVHDYAEQLVYGYTYASDGLIELFKTGSENIMAIAW